MIQKLNKLIHTNCKSPSKIDGPLVLSRQVQESENETKGEWAIGLNVSLKCKTYHKAKYNNSYQLIPESEKE